jgi:hypothetical protein
LGRIENNAARHQVQRDELGDFLRAAASYVDTHSVNQTGLLHPLHKTPDEKAALRKVRAKRARKKRADKVDRP